MTHIMRARIRAVGGAILILAFFLVFADNYNKRGADADAEAKAYSKASADASADASAESTVYSEGGQGGAGGEGGNSSAVNEGIEVDASDQSRVENNSSNIVFVPNNNTENCLRVIGIAFGKNGDRCRR